VLGFLIQFPDKQRTMEVEEAEGEVYITAALVVLAVAEALEVSGQQRLAAAVAVHTIPPVETAGVASSLSLFQLQVLSIYNRVPTSVHSSKPVFYHQQGT
jgi:hypothetical protein